MSLWVATSGMPHCYSWVYWLCMSCVVCMCSVISTELEGHFPHLVCSAEVVTVRLTGSIVYANISWTTTPPGLSVPSCPCHTDTSTALAYRRCLSDGTWLTADVSECILTVNSSVCALVSEGAPTTVV